MAVGLHPGSISVGQQPWSCWSTSGFPLLADTFPRHPPARLFWELASFVIIFS